MKTYTRSQKKVIFLLFLTVLMASWLFGLDSPMAQEEIKAGAQGNATQIDSQKMVYNRQDKIINFYGQVHVVRPDFQIWCQEMTVFLKKGQEKKQQEDGKNQSLVGKREIEKIIAQKDVRMLWNERQAQSDEAVFDTTKQIITLKGNVLVKEGMNKIQGQVAQFFLKEDRSEIRGGEKERVKAVFYPGSQEKE